MVDSDSLYRSLEDAGEDRVRKNLALKIYGNRKISLVHEWLRRKEDERIRKATSRAEAAASRAELAAEEDRRLTRSAKNAAWIAAIAAIIAAIATIINIIITPPILP